MADQLVTVEMRIRTSEDPKELGDRIREAAASITGRERLEEFRVRSMPLEQKPAPPRAVD